MDGPVSLMAPRAPGPAMRIRPFKGGGNGVGASLVVLRDRIWLKVGILPGVVPAG